MPRYLKEIKKDKEIIKGSFQIRKDFVAPWQNNLVNENTIPTSIIENKQDIKLDINSDIRQAIKPDKQDIIQNIKQDNKIYNEVAPDSKRDSNEIVAGYITRDNQEIKKDIKLDSKRDINLLRYTVKKMIGHQKKLFEYVLEFANLNDGFYSGFISSHEMANAINCTYHTVKITLFHMVKKGLLIRHKGKGCPGGYIILEIPRDVKIFYIEFNREIKKDTQRDINQDNTEFHYNNSNNKIITIGEGINFSSIQNIKLSDERLIHFTEKDLEQILKANKLSKEDIQDCIDRFSWGLKNSKQTIAYENPLRTFVGSLCKGIFWNEPGYISEQELSQQKRLEAKKKEIERKQQLEEEERQLEFKEWVQALTEEKKKKIAPNKFPPELIQLKSYFDANIWPEIKQKLDMKNE